MSLIRDLPRSRDCPSLARTGPRLARTSPERGRSAPGRSSVADTLPSPFALVPELLLFAASVAVVQYRGSKAWLRGLGAVAGGLWVMVAGAIFGGVTLAIPVIVLGGLFGAVGGVTGVLKLRRVQRTWLRVLLALALVTVPLATSLTVLVRSGIGT